MAQGRLNLFAAECLKSLSGGELLTQSMVLGLAPSTCGPLENFKAFSIHFQAQSPAPFCSFKKYLGDSVGYCFGGTYIPYWGAFASLLVHVS